MSSWPTAERSSGRGGNVSGVESGSIGVVESSLSRLSPRFRLSYGGGGGFEVVGEVLVGLSGGNFHLACGESCAVVSESTGMGRLSSRDCVCQLPTTSLSAYRTGLITPARRPSSSTIGAFSGPDVVSCDTTCLSVSMMAGLTREV